MAKSQVTHEVESHDAPQGANGTNGASNPYTSPPVLAAKAALDAAKRSKSGLAAAQSAYDDAARDAGIYDLHRPALTELGERFAIQDDTGSTIAEVFSYADQSLSFGNGQFPHVPFHFNKDLALEEAVRAYALQMGRGAANAVSDDDINTIVAKAEGAVDDETSQEVSASLLVKSIDWFLYQYNLERQALSSAERTRQGWVVALVEPDGTAITNFRGRLRTVLKILAINPSGKLPEGKWGPYSGRVWRDLIHDAIVNYVSVHRPENWKGYKASDDKPAAAPKTGNGATVSANDALME